MCAAATVVEIAACRDGSRWRAMKNLAMSTVCDCEVHEQRKQPTASDLRQYLYSRPFVIWTNKNNLHNYSYFPLSLAMGHECGRNVILVFALPSDSSASFG
jgi:hypothetical protein